NLHSHRKKCEHWVVEQACNICYLFCFSYSAGCVGFLNYNFIATVISDLQKSCKNSTKTGKIEARVSADEDLKLSDLLKYYLRESQAAKDLLYRRSRSLVDYENANKALDKARAKNKDVLQAETSQQLCCQKFEKISESAKQELIDFKTRRVAAFRKNLVELAELELKHAKVSVTLKLNNLNDF
uniref:Sorting nexin/Vps5-like C-terminal domain-containing protein n=1 Tax=Canis lupus dingo TaxID=286419 RepID=A0A8C0LL14_CANLU